MSPIRGLPLPASISFLHRRWFLLVCIVSNWYADFNAYRTRSRRKEVGNASKVRKRGSRERQPLPQGEGESRTVPLACLRRLRIGRGGRRLAVPSSVDAEGIRNAQTR